MPFRLLPSRRFLPGLGLLALLALAPSAQAIDILRSSPGVTGHSSGGTTTTTGTTSQTTSAATQATAQQAETAELAARAQSSLLLATAALHRTQAAAQTTAAALAGAATVPNGLTLGGLVPTTGLQVNGTAATAGIANPVGTSWVNASTPTQSTPTASGATTVTIVQTGEQALLTWSTFNIGKNTTLDFDQTAGGSDVGSWIAINKVAAGIAPSQILGNLQAAGQVYVLNQNGILFGGSSQVNVGALVASSLPINDNLVSVGLLNNPDLQFLFSQLDIQAGTLGPTPAFIPAAAPTTGTILTLDPTGENPAIVNAGAAAPQDGAVVVQAGAQISSPTTPEHVGGKVALIGPNVNNSGTISTPDGQTILAAGLQVGLAAHPTADASLRGLDVSIGAVADPTYDNGAAVSGTATNDGDIEADRADITMAGMTLYQNGVINSSTSVTLNGRVDLLADYGTEALVNNVNGFSGVTGLYPTLSGTVTLGAGSLIEILPELSDPETITGTQLALPSLIDIQGQAIHLATNAEILAPGAVTPTTTAYSENGAILTAGVTLDAGNWVANSDGHAFASTSGQVYLDAGSDIDVSGSENVSASVTENIVAAQLLGTELADSPLQQNGPLRGQTIYVDISQVGNYDGTEWIGTPLADVSGYVALIPHTVGELTTTGGTVAINAGDSVVTQPTSTINVSGGWINYAGGLVETTNLVSDGQIFNIADATPDRVYQGILGSFTVSSPKYGLTETFNGTIDSSAEYDPGYLQGGSAGGITITAPSMALDGSLAGNTVTGLKQQTPESTLATTYPTASAASLSEISAILAVPTSGSLSLVFEGQEVDPDNSSSISIYSPTPPAVTFQNGATDQAAVPAFALNADGSPVTLEDSSPTRVAQVDLSSDLINTDGFGIFNLTDSDGNVVLPATVSLTTAPGGSITISGANLTLDGQITASGGALSFTAYNSSPYLGNIENLLSTPAALPDVGDFTLGATASLNTAGLIFQDTTSTLPAEIAGGSVSIHAYSADLETGSSINASGGVEVSATGTQTFGKGGGIDIEAGHDPGDGAILGGQLYLGSTLSAYSGAVGKAGSLTLLAPLIQIGGTTLVNGDTSTAALVSEEASVSGNGESLLLAPEFFDQGGFGSFTLDGLGEVVASNAANPVAVDIAPGTVLDPEVAGWQVVPESTGNLILASTVFSSAALRSPVSFAFNATGVQDTFSSDYLTVGQFVLGAGSVVETDPQTSVSGGISVNADTALVLGSMIAPGGTISIKGGTSFAVVGYPSSPETTPLPTVDLGPDSVLSTAGKVELTPNTLGYTTGSVLAGGDIDIVGNIVAESGSVLNVSGASGLLDEPTGLATAGSGGSLSTTREVLTEVDSNGGSISLAGSQELFTDATLLGAAGGPSAEGGSLAVSSGVFIAPGYGAATPDTVSLIVTQGGSTIPVSDYYPTGESAIGNAVLDSQGNVITGRGYFAADSFEASGLDSLTLAGTVEFSGSVTLNAASSLSVGSGGFIFINPSTANAVVTLNAPYVHLGEALQAPLSLAEQEETLAEQAVFTYGGFAFYAPPTHGTGSLVVNATSLIDVGNTSLQDIGNVSLTATDADIRGDGTLDVAGDLALTAGQIYPTTESIFTIADYNYTPAGGTLQNGSVTIAASGTRSLPLSAGGVLNIYAADITQSGVLRAPIGTINLGSGVTSASPSDLISGETVDPTQQLNLTSGSITSVSAVDPTTGQAEIIPYGTNENGVTWIDPAGTDITLSGVPGKMINISSVGINDEAGSSIDISGGGDLLSDTFVSGTGGTVDILATSSSYAIIPGYQAGYAPINLGTGTTPSGLAVGEQVYLNGGNGLAAGVYTLLPASYALLPGAYLVTPKGGTPTASSVQPDGSLIVSGYEFNGLTAPTATPLETTFEVDSSAVVASRADYETFYASSFLSASATAAGVAVPRLPQDAGQLILAASQSLAVSGSLDSKAATGGLGGLVDIASEDAILINGTGTDSAFNGLVLNAATLSAFGAQSLLIGGYRDSTGADADVTVLTDAITVDNSGTPLTGSDIILVSNGDLTLDAGSEIEQSGTLNGAAQTLTLGISGVAGSGDGTLLRVSSAASASTSRTGVDSSPVPDLVVAADATIAGTSVTLDSTYGTSLDPTAMVTGTSVSLDSSQISLVLADASTAPTSAGLVLSSGNLSSLQAAATNLSLLSYSSIDIYGSGQIGAPSVAGVFPIGSLTLEAAGIRGYDSSGGTVTINAQTIDLANSPGASLPTTIAPLVADTTLALNAGTILLGGGTNGFSVEGYSDLDLNASGGILVQGASASTAGLATGLTTAGNLTLTTPRLTGATAANQAITATGALTLQAPTGTSPATVSGGLGATLLLQGASVTDSTDVQLTSGALTLQATGGDVTVASGGKLDAGGTEETLVDLDEYTSGGTIDLASTTGSVNLSAGSTVTVAAPSGGGNGGTLSVSAPTGQFTSQGTLLGAGGAGGAQGSFSLDVGSLPTLGSLDPILNTAGFTQSRTFRVRTGDVTLDGLATAQTFDLSADQGSITVTGTVDASGATGGTIDLTASGSVTLQSGSLLNASASTFSDAGEGGAVSLQAGAYTSTNPTPAATAVVDIQSGSVIDLAVASIPVSMTTSGASVVTLASGGVIGFPQGTPGNDQVTFTSAGTLTTGTKVTNFPAGSTLAIPAGSTVDLTGAGTIAFAAQGTGGAIALNLPASATFTTVETTNTKNAAALDALNGGDQMGTLTITAPQTFDFSGTPTGVQVDPILGTIDQASTITVVGNKIYTPAGGIIDTLDGSTGAIMTNGTAFAAAMGTDSATAFTTPGTMAYQLFANAVLQGATPVINIAPGAEIIDPTGNLTLENTWDLSTFRFGVNNFNVAVAGDLTLRAAGNLVFDDEASLTDGFTPVALGSTDASNGQWQAVLMAAGSQSWSYQLTAGADFTAANESAVMPLASLAANTGSILLGQGSPALPTATATVDSSIVPKYFQTIRTGTGNIAIAAADNVELLDPLATIYTAGTQVPGSTAAGATVTLATGTFVNPILTYSTGTLGSEQTVYPALYSDEGGNVSIFAQNNIVEELVSSTGVVTATSSKEMPTSWLERRGHTDSTGQFAATQTNGDIASTSWWVNFSNFFEGIGALGGGNVTLDAGRNIINVDAVIPTNARMVEGTPDASTMVELGGGDLLVEAGNDINGGVYYVERGQGTLHAGNSIITNSTRATLTQAEFGTLGTTAANSTTWLPTTLFLGDGSFDVSANDSVLLGAVANPFLLPQDLENSYYDDTYFSTYASTDSVSVSALTGTVTLKPETANGDGTLVDWYEDILEQKTVGSFAKSQPWLDLSEGNLISSSTADNYNDTVSLLAPVLPSTLLVTAFSGDIDLEGNLTLSPSSTGTLALVAAGSLNALQPQAIENPVEAVSSNNPIIWGEAQIDFSDANPASIPGIASPLSFAAIAGGFNGSSYSADYVSLGSVANLFDETGATDSVLQVQDALHTPGLLHPDDSDPAYLYAASGDISGLTLYSATDARVVAGQDITDSALYLQNNQADDISLVEAGRDIIAYDPTSALLEATQVSGNELLGGEAAGDIQINGPGTLEVLAGRNLTLGEGATNTNGTDTGITSVGKDRDPYLPFGGADVIAGAGLGGGAGLEDDSELNFGNVRLSDGKVVAAADASGTYSSSFISEFLDPDGNATESARYLPDLATLMNLTSDTNAQVWTAFSQLPAKQQDVLALDIFYLVLRDAGRDHNEATLPGYGNYDAGTAAIAALFPPTNDYAGDITLTSREIKTENGGNISLLAPGGQLTVGIDLAGTQPVDQGILTDDGGNISIFTHGDVNVGTSRIFTLHGGNEIIWSSIGNIDAGASSKTVAAAPPTRVLVDPTSADVETDLAGLSTGGGIGVLDTIVGSTVGDVDLIAPEGTVNAGDAGIRASGNLNIAAVQVLNAGNISVGGKSAGVPTTSAPNLGSIAAASSAAGAASNEATEVAQQNQPTPTSEDLPSLVTVEVLGYGGSDSDDD